MHDGLVTQLLTYGLFQLPALVVYVAGLSLLVTRRAGRPRSLGLWGLGLLVLVLGTALSLLPLWLLSNGASFRQYAALFAALRGLIGLVSAAGVLLLVLALRFALPPR